MLNAESLIQSGAFKTLGETEGGAVSLVLSLVLLCLALYALVWVLRKLVMGERGNGQESWLRRALNASTPVVMLIGFLLTVAVQSSSVSTSAITPLVGLGIVTLEKAFPFTLGANIGTTCTALLASLVTGSSAALQIAVVHTLFNVVGAAVIYPIPLLRHLPLRGARAMGDLARRHRWVPPLYAVSAFVVLPLSVIGVTTMLEAGGVLMGLGVAFIVVAVAIGAGAMRHVQDQRDASVGTEMVDA